MKNVVCWTIALLSLSVLPLPFVTAHLMGNEVQWSAAEILGNVASPSDNTLAHFVHHSPSETDGVGRIIDNSGFIEADLAQFLPFLCATVYVVFAITVTLLKKNSKRMIIVVAAVGCISSVLSIGVIYLLNEAVIRSVGDHLRGAEGTLGYNIGVELLEDVWLRPAVGAYALAGCSAMLLVAQALPRKNA